MKRDYEAEIVGIINEIVLSLAEGEDTEVIQSIARYSIGRLVQSERALTLGWCVAECDAQIGRGEGLGTIEVPEFLDRANKDLGKIE